MENACFGINVEKNSFVFRELHHLPDVVVLKFSSFFFFFDYAGCGVLVPQTRIEPWRTAVKPRTLTTGELKLLSHVQVFVTPGTVAC